MTSNKVERILPGRRWAKRGYLLEWPRIWTRDYGEQIQPAIRARLELGGPPKYKSRGPFLEIPGNFSGPKSNVQIEM